MTTFRVGKIGKPAIELAFHLTTKRHFQGRPDQKRPFDNSVNTAQLNLLTSSVEL